MYFPAYKKINIKTIDRIDIKDFLIPFLQTYHSFRIKIKNKEEATIIKEQISIPNNPQFGDIKSINGYPYWGSQRIDFIKSNLRGERGFIFYFLCSRCSRKAKYLYFLSYGNAPLCRICCNLKYDQPNRKIRALSRTLNKPYLSSENKYMLMKRAGITKEDIKDYLSDNCKDEP